MGILRTDKVSGLETPTPVTGSVLFDADGDYLDTTVPVLTTNDFTFEMWINTDNTSQGYVTVFEYGLHNSSSDGIICQVRNTGGVTGIYTRNGTTDTSGAGISSPYPIKVGEWNHIAITRDGTTVRFHVNGVYTGYGTWSKDFTATDLRIGSRRYSSPGEYFDGYISNFRMLKGIALYTNEDFTPPVHELEVIGDTVLLCCNNTDSVGADGTGKTITANGDPAASTVSPGLTRDFTSGTEFNGVTTFDTQGYFVPPSGTTEQRGRGRGFFAGGGTTPNYTNAIDFITISSSGNAQDFGDLTQEKQSLGGTANSTRGIFASGYNTPTFPATGNNTDRIEYITTATTGNGIDFGNLDSAIRYASCAANSTRGLIAGGYTPTYIDRIEYITIASLGNAQTFGTLTTAGTATDKAGLSSPTRALFAGGEGPSMVSQIDYVTIATLGNAADFGDLTAARRRAASASSGTRGLVANGYNGSAYVNTIDYVTMATTGNAQDFGDTYQAKSSSKGQVSSTIRGVFGSGVTPSATNIIDYVTIATTGNAQDFGDTNGSLFEQAGCSDSHGGLS